MPRQLWWSCWTHPRSRSQQDLAAAQCAPSHTADDSAGAGINSDLAPINPSLVDPLRHNAAGKSPGSAAARADQHAAAHHDQRRRITCGRADKSACETSRHRTPGGGSRYPAPSDRSPRDRIEAKVANGSYHRSDYCPDPSSRPTPNVTGRIHQHRRRIAHIPVQVRVAGGEAERVLGGPAAGGRVEVAGAVVVQARLGVELAGGEQDRVDQ